MKSSKGVGRLAIINHDRCKPKKCNHECQLKCPPMRVGKLCIEIENVAKINESLCIGCGACVKACPFNAVQIVNLPSELNLADNLFYTYGQNSFRLYRIPTPKIGKIFGIIGQNGVGKSTLLGILSGSIRPNFGKSELELDDISIMKSVRGTELQKYFDLLYKGKLSIRLKQQNIDIIQRKIAARNQDITLETMINRHYDKNNHFHNRILDTLELRKLFDYKISNLSGGEMQRLCCAQNMMIKADVYIFDEPTNYLDIKQRLAVADLIRELSGDHKYVFVVEHDMSILDYTSDIVTILYGVPGAYGVVSTPYSTSDAINIYFSGYIPCENMRFRTEPFTLKDGITIQYEEEMNIGIDLKYDANIIQYNNFKLVVDGGVISSQTSIVVLMGRNGTGKTTFLNDLSQKLELGVSYKRQYIDISEYNGVSIKDLLFEKIKKSMCSELFLSDVINTFGIKSLYDRKVEKLSGGELQKLAITLCLGEEADIYLIDEPSACLDIEQRVLVTKILKRFLTHNQKIGFIVEHDIMMAISLGLEPNSKIVVFDEKVEDGVRVANCSKPMIFIDGINGFLKQLNITFRTDHKIKRPRINKLGSQKDVEQKSSGRYYSKN